jgi:hypothetical protein
MLGPAAGSSQPNLAEHAMNCNARAEGLGGWELQALNALISPGDGIQLAVIAGDRRTSYINGQHKSQALLEAGVRRTIVIDWVTATPTT